MWREPTDRHNAGALHHLRRRLGRGAGGQGGGVKSLWRANVGPEVIHHTKKCYFEQIKNMSDPLPRPPKHLSRDAKRYWREIVAAYELEPTHLLLLAQACDAMDAAEQHRRIVAEQGATVVDRFKQVREHPSGKAMRDATHQFRQSIKSLGLLDSDPDPHRAGRPPASIAQPRSKR